MVDIMLVSTHTMNVHTCLRHSPSNNVSTAVFLEMTLGFLGIFCNLMVVTTVRNHDQLQESTRY